MEEPALSSPALLIMSRSQAGAGAEEPRPLRLRCMGSSQAALSFVDSCESSTFTGTLRLTTS